MMQPSHDPEASGGKDLPGCACTVAERYRHATSTHPQSTGLPLAWRGLLKELKSSCPGFTDIEYGIALTQAFAAPPIDSLANEPH